MTAPSTFSLLVVDDEPDLRTLYELTLLREGYDVDSAGTVDEAWLRLCERGYHAVITDMRLPDGSGLDLLRKLEDAGRAEKAIVITAYGSAENAVEALKAGAFDYLTKPVDLRQFRSVVASALGRVVGPAAPQVAGPAAPPVAAPPVAAATAPSTARAGRPVAATASAQPVLQRLVGESATMQQVRALVERVARGMAPVMIQGESGTGKELVARAIHGVSARAAMPFIAVNCGAIPEQLLEAEFFGYRKGAFSGATEDREGFFQAAHGGTLFLDEIGDLPLAMQSKLLRAIQERSVRQIGAVSEVPVNVRIVSATHKDLGAEVHEGRFRQDLYYRLNVIQIRVPALRERIEDMSLLCDTVLERIAREAAVSPAPRLSADALACLQGYGFPGNVRELENLLHRAVALSDSELIAREDLGLGDEAFVESSLQPLDALAPAEAPPATAPAMPAALPSDLVSHLDQVERDILARALERHRFNRTAAGASLGLSLRQMRYRMARLGIVAADQDSDGMRPRSAGAWQQGWWLGAERRHSPNFGLRPPGTAVELVIVHSISLPPGVYGGDAIERLFANRLDPSGHPSFESLRGLQVSAHLLVRRDGQVLQFVSCDDRAWHAGASSWAGRDDCNDWSVGVELEGLEGDAFEAAQYQALAGILRALARHYPIAQVVGHEHVAPGRKGDPGAAFDWAGLRRRLRWPARMFSPR